MLTFLLLAALWSRFAIWHFIKRRYGPLYEAGSPWPVNSHVSLL